MHAELHHAGWVQSSTGKHHYFMPGISFSECGAFRIEDDAVRIPTEPRGIERCGNCDKAKARLESKLRDDHESDTEGTGDEA